MMDARVILFVVVVVAAIASRPIDVWLWRYEGQADDFERQDGIECVEVPRMEFAAAWERPYAKRSRLRRFLSWLNGVQDAPDPSERDEAIEQVAASN